MPRARRRSGKDRETRQKNWQKRENSPDVPENGILMGGMIAVADVIRADSSQAVKELQDMGIEVVMLTGDNERTAKAIGRQAGVDRVIAGVLPDGKEEVIRKLKEQGKACYGR